MKDTVKSILPYFNDCPCGCKKLVTNDRLKRHLSILGFMVFITTLGLVALNTMEREKTNVNPSHLASNAPGAIQAAETTFPTLTPTENNYTYSVPIEQQQVLIPIEQMQAHPEELRAEAPSHMTLAVTGMDGKTRIKRIVGR